MGSRWRGLDRAGAMPFLHQYLGTPVTTWILNRLYSSQFSDIHCGMRGITRDALERMDLQSQSWEYASEMVLKSVHMELRTAEVPGPLPEGPGGPAQPPQARGLVLAVEGGVDQPARDVRLRRRLLRAASPGSCCSRSACCSRCRSASAPVDDRPRDALAVLDARSGVTLTVVGLRTSILGCIAQVLYDYTGAATARWTARCSPTTARSRSARRRSCSGIALDRAARGRLRARAGLALPASPAAVQPPRGASARLLR